MSKEEETLEDTDISTKRAKKKSAKPTTKKKKIKKTNEGKSVQIEKEVKRNRRI